MKICPVQFCAMAAFCSGLLVGGDLLIAEEQDTYSRLYWYSHSGWLPGFQSIANYEDSIDAVVVLFLNNTGGNSENIISTTYNSVLGVLRRE